MDEAKSSAADNAETEASKAQEHIRCGGAFAFATISASLLWGLLLLFIACAVAAVCWDRVSPSGLPLHFEVREVQGKAHSKLRERRYSIILHNTRNWEVRVVGANTLCGPLGCIEVTPLPLAIPPRGKAELEVTYTAPKVALNNDILGTTLQDFMLELYVDDQMGKTLTIPVPLPAAAGGGR